MERNEQVPDDRLGPLARAIVNVGVVLLAVLALDDITTDNDTSFVLERVAVAGCGVWFGVMTYQLWRGHRRLLAVVSAGVLAAAAVAQRGIGPGTVAGARDYLVTVGALVWFLVVAVFLAASTWRAGRSHAGA